jgi:hypothetical protein
MSAVFYWNKRPLITKWLLFSALAAEDGRARGRFMDALPDKGVTYLKTINYPARVKTLRFIKMSTGPLFWKLIDSIRHHVGLSLHYARKHPVEWRKYVGRGPSLPSQLGRKLFPSGGLFTKLTALSAGRLRFLCALRAHFVGNTHINIIHIYVYKSVRIKYIWS